MNIKIPKIPKLSKPVWGVIIAVVAILAAIPGLGLVWFTTGHPFFCLSCHEYQQGVAEEMWLGSRVHPASIGCVDCHTAAGQLFPRKFSAGDDFMNKSCLSCHPTIPKGEQTDIKDVRVVKISHKLHAEKKVLCIDCHRNIEHDRRSPRTNRPTMEACYGCHQAHPRTQSCDKCHPINLETTKKQR